VINFENNFMAY